VERLGETIDAGARLIIFNPVFDLREQLEILAQEIIPKIAGR